MTALSASFLWCTVGLAAFPTPAVFQAEDRFWFAMLGAENVVYHIHADTQPFHGIQLWVVTAAGQKQWKPAFVKGRVRHDHEPLFVHHSPELGQLAILPYDLGGGTGILETNYVVLCCRNGTCAVLLNEMFEGYESLSLEGAPCYELSSQIRAAASGFIQTVAVRLWTQHEDAAKADDERKVDSIEIRFRFELTGDKVVVHRSIGDSSIHALLDILDSQPNGATEWAASQLLQRWPKLDAEVHRYLAADQECERAKAAQELRERIKALTTE